MIWLYLWNKSFSISTSFPHEAIESIILHFSILRETYQIQKLSSNMLHCFHREFKRPHCSPHSIRFSSSSKVVTSVDLTSISQEREECSHPGFVEKLWLPTNQRLKKCESKATNVAHTLHFPFHCLNWKWWTDYHHPYPKIPTLLNRFW